MPARREPADGGFTLVELLIAIVILPLVIGAAATAVVAAQTNTGTAKNQISDSANANVTTNNFIRDVQGAAYLTTLSTATSPTPVCGSGTSLLLAGARSGSASFSVAYWYLASPAEVIRTACAFGSSTPSSTLVVSDDAVGSSALQPVAAITPSAFAALAASGWASVAALTTVTSLTTLPSANIPVTSTSGFTAGYVQVQACADGPSCASPVNETLACSAATATMLTGCSGGSGVVLSAATAAQASAVTAVHLAITQPASGATLSLRAVPRTATSFTNGLGLTETSGPGSGAGGAPGGGQPNETANGGPAILTLGPGGMTLQGGNGATLTVSGSLDTSSGVFDCGNVPAANVTVTGYENLTGSSSVTGSCLSGTAVTTLTSPTPDPLSANLPVPLALPPTMNACYGSGAATYATGPCAPTPAALCLPGEYLQALPPGCTLQPGVYILDGGYSASGQAALRMAAGSGTSGVLLYLPCITGSCSESLSMGGSSSLSVPGLSAAQARSYFGTTALTGIVVWQDKGDTATSTIGGTPSSITPGGLYLPGATVALLGNAGGFYGQIIASAVTVQGSASLTVSPPGTTP